MKLKVAMCLLVTVASFLFNGCGSLYNYNHYSSNDSTQYSKDLFGIINKDSSKTTFYNNTGKVLHIKNTVFGKSVTGEYITIGIDQIKEVTTSESKVIPSSELTTDLISQIELFDGTIYSFDNNYGSLINDKKIVLGYNSNKESIAVSLDEVNSLEIEEVNGVGKFFEFGVVLVGLFGVALIAALFAFSGLNVSVGG